MSESVLENAIENIYASLNNDNEDIDVRIIELKEAAALEGVKVVAIKSDRLPVPNREGRLLLKSYFKKRGVTVEFEK